MNDSALPTADRDALLGEFAAELTHVAYRVALRHGSGGGWLDLELELWRALAGTLRQRGWQPPPGHVPPDSRVRPHEVIP